MSVASPGGSIVSTGKYRCAKIRILANLLPCFPRGRLERANCGRRWLVNTGHTGSLCLLQDAGRQDGAGAGAPGIRWRPGHDLGRPQLRVQSELLERCEPLPHGQKARCIPPLRDRLDRLIYLSTILDLGRQMQDSSEHSPYMRSCIL